MSESWEKHTATFDVVNAGGQQYRILELTTYVDGSAVGELDIPQAHKRRYQLENGEAVSRISDEEFKIVPTGECVKVML